MSLQRPAVKESRLRARLASRFQQVLTTFQESVLEFNKILDEQQMRQLADLKALLQCSHNETGGVLQMEEQRVESHSTYLEKYSKTLADASDDEMLPPFTDPYHSAEMRPNEEISCFQSERQRLLTLCTAAKSAYEARLEAIAKCELAFAERERERRDGMRESLVKLVSALVPIAYVSITGNQVLAQRVIHSMNRRLCESHACAAALLSQLRCREVLRYRTYGRRLAGVYGASLRLMAAGRRLWAVTFLRTAHLRRPAGRDRIVQETLALAAAGRRAGGEFLRATRAAAETLRRRREPTARESGAPPPPGGSCADGWLRAFDGRLDAPVFTASPVDVAVEWRVKANVLVRNTVARAVAHVNAVREWEQRLCNEAERVYTTLHAVLRWVCTPETEETIVWANASLQGIDTIYLPFTTTNDVLLANLTTEVDREVPPLLLAIRRESKWFTDAVEAELQSQYTTLEELLLTGTVNVLTIFQRATEALEATTTRTMGFIRTRLLAISDARKDHEDTLQLMETELVQCQTRLQHAIAKEAVEVLFVKGLRVLERIAAEHTEFHRNTVQMLQRVMRETPEEVERHCVALLRLLGLESEESYEQRLEQERRGREAAAVAAAAAAAASSSKRARAKEVVVELHSESDEEDTTPPCPTITAADGQVYYIVAPMTLDDRQRVGPPETPPTLPSSEAIGGQGMKGRTLIPLNKRKGIPPPVAPASQQQQQQEGRRIKVTSTKQQSVSESTRSTSEPVTGPLSAFVHAYETLLKPMVSEDNGSELLSVDAVEQWREMLRCEILNWVIDLSRTSCTYVQEECASRRSVIDREANEVLRYHRRRPASLQAETYEVRLRDIENTHTVEEKYTKRLRDRVAHMEVVFSSIAEDDDMGDRDAKLLEQLQELEMNAKTAGSVNLLRAQEREFASLVSSSVEDHARRHQKLLAELAREQESLESECRSHILDFGMVIPTNLDEVQDCSSFGSEGSVCREAMEALLRLHAAAKAVKDKLAVQYEQHMRCVDAARVSYSTVFEKNVGELQMLARLKEVLTRLKVQVHSLIALSDASEAKIEKILKDFEEKINAPTPVYNFANSLYEITGRDYGAAAAGPHGSPIIDGTTIGKKEVGALESLTLEHARSAEEELGGRLAEVRLDIQRQIRSSDVAKVLRLLDSLREALYTRGRHLNCLQYGVEFFNVPLENYIEPRLDAAPDLTSTEATGTHDASLPLHNRASRRSRTPAPANSVLASLYTIGELPEVIPVELEVGQWLAAVKTQVDAIAGQHFSECPSSLTRRLSGMTGGRLEDVTEKSNSVCGQQRQRVLQHIQQATRRYRQQVQRVFDMVQKLPAYLNSSVYNISASSLERRVETVFAGFASFYGESEMMRGVYDRLVKVTLGSNYNREKLDALRNAEGARQEVTQKAIEKFWGYALREMEDEATMHAARALNVNNNFFAFLQGLVTPEKLKPPVDDDVNGQHRGLRRLLQLKEREGRTREMQLQRPPSPKRDRRLQETMPRQKQAGLQAEKNPASGRRFDHASDLTSGPLPIPVTREVEYVRVPLHAFRPLGEFNAAHPNATVEALNQDVTPTFARVSLTPHPHSGTGGGRRRKTEGISRLVSEDVVSIVAPASLLCKETAELAQQSVELFNRASGDVAMKTSDSFQQWADRELTWKDIWNVAISRLKA